MVIISHLICILLYVTAFAHFETVTPCRAAKSSSPRKHTISFDAREYRTKKRDRGIE